MGSLFLFLFVFVVFLQGRLISLFSPLNSVLFELSIGFNPSPCCLQRSFEEYFPEQDKMEKSVWQGLLVTAALGLGALATMVAVR